MGGICQHPGSESRGFSTIFVRHVQHKSKITFLSEIWTVVEANHFERPSRADHRVARLYGDGQPIDGRKQ